MEEDLDTVMQALSSFGFGAEAEQISRTLSRPSQQAIKTLGDLKREMSEFEDVVDKITQGRATKDEVMKLRDEVERFQRTRLNAVMTDELTSGKQTAIVARKFLDERANTVLEFCDECVGSEQISRTLSRPSQRAIKTLVDLQREMSEFEDVVHEIRRGRAKKDEVMKLRCEVERFQMTRIDAVMTGELTSGKQTAIVVRQKLNKRANTVLEFCDQFDSTHSD